MVDSNIKERNNPTNGFKITKEQLKQIVPNISSRNLDVIPFYINEYAPKYGIVTVNQMVDFIANAAVESGEFNSLRENMNYSVDGLLKVFKKYFPTREMAAKYAHNPEKIGNYVYANRNGNGPEGSGDGYNYRGAGIFQTTGRANFAALSQHIYGDIKVLLERPSDVATPMLAVQSALYYWQSNNLNRFVEKDDFKALVKAINGGYNHFEEREKYRDRARKVFGID